MAGRSEQGDLAAQVAEKVAAMVPELKPGASVWFKAANGDLIEFVVQQYGGSSDGLRVELQDRESVERALYITTKFGLDRAVQAQWPPAQPCGKVRECPSSWSGELDDGRVSIMECDLAEGHPGYHRNAAGAYFRANSDAP